MLSERMPIDDWLEPLQDPSGHLTGSGLESLYIGGYQDQDNWQLIKHIYGSKEEQMVGCASCEARFNRYQREEDIRLGHYVEDA